MPYMDINLTGQAFNDYLLSNVGSAAFELEHDWFTRQDLLIRTAAGGAGTLLVEGTDYTLSIESEELSDRVTAAVGSTRNVFHMIVIINAMYQTGDLYFSGKYIADSNSAEDVNMLQDQVNEIVPFAGGFISGLVLSNSSGDPNNDIDIASGRCLAKGGTGANDTMVLASVLTKRSDASWAAGSGNGGMVAHFANPQTGRAEQALPDDHPDLMAFREKSEGKSLRTAVMEQLADSLLAGETWEQAQAKALALKQQAEA